MTAPDPPFMQNPSPGGWIIHPERHRNILGRQLYLSGKALDLESGDVAGLPEFDVEQELLPFGGVRIRGVRSVGS